MAMLRRFGNLANILLASHLRSREDEYQSELTKQRQLEIADQQNKFRAAQAADVRQQKLLEMGLNDPSKMAQFAANGIDVGMDPNMFRPKDELIINQLGSKIAGMNREQLPTDLGVEATLGATPWAADLAKDPRAVKAGMNFRDDRRGQLDEIDAYNIDKTGATAFAQSRGQAMGQESADADNAPAKLARKVTDFNTMAPLEFVKLQKEETMKAMLALEKFKKETTYRLAAEGQQQFAKALNDQIIGLQNAAQGMEEIISLAEEVNNANIGPIHDVYSGFKDSLGTLPYVGSSLRGLMATGTAAAGALVDGDPSLVMKAQRLEAARREAALRAIRAAGDPRPSDQDVLGVLPTIPGAGMSREATAEAASYWRDALTLIPELAAKNPGVMGKALLDLAQAEAKRRTAMRGTTPQLPPDPLNPRPQGALHPSNPAYERSNQTPTNPLTPLPSHEVETPSQRLQRLRNAGR